MPDYMYMLESRLSSEQRAALLRIQELAAAIDANLYLSGGAVRDLISGMGIRDLDFTVEGNPSRIVKDLEKGGARIVAENEALRQAELILASEVEVSIAAARDEIYAYPGTRPEIRFSPIMDDLRRRDFSLNAIAISLNPNSRGLLLDPANGLADLERHEIRVLSIHSFTNQPVRLLRAVRYAVRMGFKLEQRTSDWMRLAIERGLLEKISGADAGNELRQVAREEKPTAILKAWESQNLLGALHPLLAKKHPGYDAIERLIRIREDMWNAGYRPRLYTPMILAVLGRFKQRDRGALLAKLEFRAPEIRAFQEFEQNAAKAAKLLSGSKTGSPRDAYAFLETVPLDLLAYLLAQSSNSKVTGKIRAFLYKWKPLRQGLRAAAADLEGLGLERGSKFDKVLEDFFQVQLAGRARKPEDRIKVLRKLSGIKEAPKKPEKEERKKTERARKKSEAAVPPEPALSAKVPARPAVSSRPGKPAAKAIARKPAKKKQPASAGKKRAAGRKGRGKTAAKKKKK